MLCSHTKKFIYLKTRKTAGTSVEIFFEPYCLPEGTFSESHGTREAISEAGIVGSRMEGSSKGDKFYNHMPAVEVRDRLGPEIFDSYFKFCAVRNPFDKVVSHFWWRYNGRPLQKAVLSKLPFAMVKAAFASYVKKSGAHLHDRDIFMIGGKPVVDAFIRYENLAEDMGAVCGKLGIPFDESRLGRYKSGVRIRPEHFTQYYDDRTRRLVAQTFAWELERFQYRFD